MDSSGYTSRRTDLQMQPWEQEGISFPKMRAFHSAWLMYIDGDEHKTLRQLVLGVVKSVAPSSVGALHIMSESCAQGVLEETGIDAMSLAWHRDFLGLTIVQQSEVLGHAQRILLFFFFDEVPTGGVAELEGDIDCLHTWFESEQFQEDGLMFRLKMAGVPVSTQLNIIIDSLEPIRCALSTLLYQLASTACKGMAPADMVQEVLRLYPPFRFINRMEVCPVSHGNQKTGIDLYKVNRDASVFPNPHHFHPDTQSRRHMSFGYGRHSCPGAGVSVKFLEDVVQTLKGHQLALLEGELETDKGFCRVKNLKIEVRAV